MRDADDGVSYVDHLSMRGAAGVSYAVTRMENDTLWVVKSPSLAPPCLSECYALFWDNLPILGLQPVQFQDVVTREERYLAVATVESLPIFHLLQSFLRKHDHIELCSGQNVEETNRFTGFDQLHLEVCALPDFDLCDLDCRTSFLGRTFPFPLLLTGMTGGVLKGQQINLHLARAAVKCGLPMGVGSQRMALENEAFAPLFQVKKHVPDVFLIGNLGVAQLQGPSEKAVDLCKRAVEQIEADALALHVNVLQELIQPEGDVTFSGFWDNLEKICAQLEVPVLVKEVGSGIDPRSALRLAERGVAAIDLGGRGGTSWGYLEGLRSSELTGRQVGATFRDWGIPTAYALAALDRQRIWLPKIATGGIRNGLT
ncbi:MAG: type 2 isopentenyl-diphosphate Delta-isomerase, partial [Zetaproteobacteria bacterium]|nr:type 2 isopentenyl-diphosphate Delta-isomerase [Zetaproteobacteria bacterium]